MKPMLKWRRKGDGHYESDRFLIVRDYGKWYVSFRGSSEFRSFRKAKQVAEQIDAILKEFDGE